MLAIERNEDKRRRRLWEGMEERVKGRGHTEEFGRRWDGGGDDGGSTGGRWEGKRKRV